MHQQPLPYYIRSGNGPCLLLLHGFCEDHYIWNNLTLKLQKKYTVITPDLPGFGLSDNIAFVSIQDMADAIYSMLQAEGITKCVVAGHSMGGYVGLALADKYPSVCSGLLLFHSTATADDTAKKQGRQNAIASIEQYGTRPFLTQFFSTLVTKDYAKKHPKQVQTLKQRAQLLPPQTLVAAMQAMMQRPNTTHVLRQAQFPVGFIAGQYDSFIPLSTTLTECYIPNIGSICILPDTAHAGMFENSQLSMKQVKEFARFCFDFV